MCPDSPHDSNLRRPHPLAAELIERLHVQPRVRVLEIGSGSGRNTAALERAGFAVHSVPDRSVDNFTAERGFDGALSTHALLHGTHESIAVVVQRIGGLLEAGAPFYATFGSKADSRYGRGIRIADDVFAPEDGAERGVPHAFFGEGTLREMLERHFTIESMEARNVDDVVGRWAHAQRPQGTVHWIVRSHR